MPLVIDTYNVLHVTGVLPPELAVGEPEGLARLIAVSRHAAEVVWLVCDGVPRGAARVGRILIEGAGPGRSADDHIMSFLDRTSAPRQVTVVTSDRAIQRHARSRGAQCIKSEEFLAALAQDAARTRPRRGLPPDPRRSVPLGEREVIGWMRLFGVTAELAAIEASPKDRLLDEKSDTTSQKPIGEASASRSSAQPRVSSRSDDRALERYLEATKGLADPLSILEEKRGDVLLAELGALDDAAIDAMMKAHEPPILKDGARIGGRKRVRDRKKS